MSRRRGWLDRFGGPEDVGVGVAPPVDLPPGYEPPSGALPGQTEREAGLQRGHEFATALLTPNVVSAQDLLGIATLDIGEAIGDTHVVTKKGQRISSVTALVVQGNKAEITLRLKLVDDGITVRHHRGAPAAGSMHFAVSGKDRSAIPRGINVLPDAWDDHSGARTIKGKVTGMRFMARGASLDDIYADAEETAAKFELPGELRYTYGHVQQANHGKSWECWVTVESWSK